MGYQRRVHGESSKHQPSGHTAVPIREDNMDSKLVISTAVFLVLTFIESGDSLKCYQCNSYVDANCADPFFYAEEADKKPEDRVMKDPSMLTDCPEDTAERTHFCRKIAQTVRDDDRVIRSCGWIPDDKGRDCYTTVLEEYNTLVCACKEEGCNGANGFSVSMFATLSALLLAYLIH